METGHKKIVSYRKDKGTVARISLDNGTLLWSHPGWQNPNAIPFPMQLPGDRIFITGGYNADSAMLDIPKEAARCA